MDDLSWSDGRKTVQHGSSIPRGRDVILSLSPPPLSPPPLSSSPLSSSPLSPPQHDMEDGSDLMERSLDLMKVRTELEVSGSNTRKKREEKEKREIETAKKREKETEERKRQERLIEMQRAQERSEIINQTPVPWLSLAAEEMKKGELCVGEDEFSRFRERGVFDFMENVMNMRVKVYDSAKAAFEEYREDEEFTQFSDEITETMNQFAPERLDEKVNKMQTIDMRARSVFDGLLHPATLFCMINRIRIYIEGPDINVGSRELEQCASFCTQLCERIAEIRPLFEGMMIKRCPFVVPKYLERRKDASDGLVRVAYNVDTGKYDEQIEKRMTKVMEIFAIYCGKCRVPTSALWLWLSAICNADINPVMLEMIAIFVLKHDDALIDAYGRQMTKLLKFLDNKVCLPGQIPVYWNEDDKKWWRKDKLKHIVEALRMVMDGERPFPKSENIGWV